MLDIITPFLIFRIRVSNYLDGISANRQCELFLGSKTFISCFLVFSEGKYYFLRIPDGLRVFYYSVSCYNSTTCLKLKKECTP